MAFDPDGTSPEDLIEVIEGVEEVHEVHKERFSHERPEHPGDIEPIRRQAIAIGADVVALGGGLFGQLLRVTPIPAELGSLVALAENEPRIRHFIEQHLGVGLTDLGLGITSAFVQSLSQVPLTLATDITHRANRLGELQAMRRAWERREADLCSTPHDESIDAVSVPIREAPLCRGPVEGFADISSALSVAGAAATLALTGSPRRAGGIVTAAVPKAARHGRDAFAARLGRELAARDVIVLDSEALLRLDRVDVVVLDAAVLTTGRVALGAVEPVGDLEAAAVGLKALELFDPTRSSRLARRGAWRVAPMASIDAQLPVGTAARVRALGRGRPGVLGVTRSGALVGLIALELELDPLADPLAHAVRRGGHQLLVAGLRSGLRERIGADGLVAGGSRLAATVRSLQKAGHGVLLVSGSPAHAALRGRRRGWCRRSRRPESPGDDRLITRRHLSGRLILVC